MTYSIRVHEDFKKDLAKLSQPVKDQLYKKLQKVQENPHVPKNQLRGELSSCYKIKLLKAGVRLVYQVIDDELIILLVTVGKRADSEVYEEAKQRIHE
ncbi:MAG: type II toxin-antitoxin system RelE/ParE family toxin [Pseudomonadales bacterium]|nr:type II toxin-antitoxin system RelE/ParE family toxin [Pseudomonadales bacterium]